MQITRQADYAVRALLYLAQRVSYAPAATAQIAREQKIPVTFLAKIVAQLSAAGILHTTRGMHGGVALARPSAEVSLLEIVEAIDGPILLNDCVVDPTTCPLGENCAVQRVWCDAQTALVWRLEGINFSQLVRAPAPLAAPDSA